MHELVKQGLSFPKVAKETLRDIVGETSSGVMFLAFGDFTGTPREFVQKVSILFPAATQGILLALVAKRARVSLASPGTIASDSQYEFLLRRLGELQEVKTRQKSTLLHDHREEDELDRLVGHKTE